MAIDRRTFLATGLVGVAGAASVVPAAEAHGASGTAAAAAAAPQYPSHRAPLRPDAFLRLPPDAVRPAGWLATQLRHQLDGLCGRYPEASHFLSFDSSGWVRPDRPGWEEVPYWLRGFVDLAFVTRDPAAQATARRWMDAVLTTQAPDGYFGPTVLRTSLNGHADLWPHMPMLHALRSYAEFTRDGRVEQFLGRFLAYAGRQPAAVFAEGWGATRWADTIDVAYWLHDRTGDNALLDLVRRIHAYSADWVSGIPSLHNVNVAQGFREPAQYGVLTGDPAMLAATRARYDTIMREYGQFPGGGFAGDENARPGFGDPRQGFETCGIVEFMQSHEILARITGDAAWADRTEELAFNSLPASLDPRGRSIHYVTSANSVQLDDGAKTQGQYQNGFAMQAYKAGVDQYRCCPHNYGQGWPYYVEEMWLATPDGGLAAALYGPCTVTARVADGVTVTITETTTYPFEESISFTLSLPRPASFPLALRIPGWCTDPQLRVNGAALSAVAGPNFATVTRTWSNGDTVNLRLPMRPRLRTWTANKNAVSIDHGPLTMSLLIDERWMQTGGSTQFPQWEVRAASPWNYGIVPGAAITVHTGGGQMDDPFAPAASPLRLVTSARRIPDWRPDSQDVVTPLQDGPVASTAPVEQVTLVPMGAARLRITSFPHVGGTRPWAVTGAAFRLRNRHSGKVLGVDGMSMADSARVVQFADTGTLDHLWRLVDAGDGWVKVQNANSGRLLAVDGMSTADSARVVQFADTGTADHLWRPLDGGNGYLRLQNRHSGKVLGVDGMSTADSAQVVQFTDNGTADHDWLIVPDGPVRLSNLHSGKVLAVADMSQADSARVVQFADVGTDDHLWEFLDSGDGWFRLRNMHSGKVLAVDGMSTADSAPVVQFADSGTADHLWRLAATANGSARLVNRHSGKVLAVDEMSTADSAQVVQFADTGTADHLWRLV